MGFGFRWALGRTRGKAAWTAHLSSCSGSESQLNRSQDSRVLRLGRLGVARSLRATEIEQEAVKSGPRGN